jgi:prevent-host-death family protein
MEKPVSAADANREFSRLLQDVKKGHSYIVTSHGKPVAKIAPVGERSRFAEKARTVLLARLRAEPTVEIGRWTRDELYARSTTSA